MGLLFVLRFLVDFELFPCMTRMRKIMFPMWMISFRVSVERTRGLLAFPQLWAEFLSLQ